MFNLLFPPEAGIEITSSEFDSKMRFDSSEVRGLT